MNYTIRALLVAFCVWFIPMLALMFALYAVATHPMRRRERARLLLDLLSAELRAGRSVEQTIVSVSATRTKELGVRFHLLAAYLEEGMRFDAAIKVVRTGLPAPLTALLSHASEAGGLEKLLPAARRMLNDASSRAHSSMNYVFLVLMLFTPGLFIVMPVIHVFVWPKMQQIMLDLEIPPPALSQLIWGNSEVVIACYAIGLLGFASLTFLYLWNPQFLARSRGGWRFAQDWLAWQLPWARKRGWRDFSLILGTALDAGVPEETAFRVAAESTANLWFIQRCEKSIDKLKQGSTLVATVGELDLTGELGWRLANAAHGARDFVASLRGWHEMLESKAFQAEQTAAHLFTSTFIVLNGAVVGVFIASVFLIIIAIVNEGTLW